MRALPQVVLAAAELDDPHFLSPLPCFCTVPVTLLPATKGLPTLMSAPWPTTSTLSNSTAAPGSASELLETHHVAFGDAVLLAARRNDRVHILENSTGAGVHPRQKDAEVYGSGPLESSV